MLVFIDESGDAGFKTTAGSSKFFVIALIIFDDDLDAEETALCIKRLRQKLGKDDRFEFKFNKTDRNLKIRFFETVSKMKFRIRSISFNKELIYSKTLRSEKEKFYNYALRNVLDMNNNTIKNAKIRLDGLGERKFKQELVKYLRDKLNSDTRHVMKNLKFQDSRSNVLIQLADMIAGAIRRSHENESDKENFIRFFSKLIEDDWEFK